MVTEWWDELRAEEPDEDEGHGELAERAGVMVTEVDEVLLLVLLLRWVAISSAEGLKGNRRLLLDNFMKFGRLDCISRSLDEYRSGVAFWRTLSLGDENALRYLEGDIEMITKKLLSG